MKIIDLFEDFNSWFGNSKVVDSNGKPLRVYHGTSKNFDEFKKSKKKKSNAYSRDGYIGIFFSDNPKSADFYSGGHYDEDGAITMPVYLSLQNPLIKNGNGKYKKPEIMMDWKNEAIQNGNDGIIVLNIRDTPTVDAENLYIAFKPNQIKSAIGNIGTFNPKSKKITETWYTSLLL